MKSASPETKIQAEIRRRAFERANHRILGQNHMQNDGFTLDALEEVTGLSRSELEQIAAEVRASFVRPRRDYFSIKAQLILVLGSIGILILLLVLLLLWIF
jgi:hypothetical protein